MDPLSISSAAFGLVSLGMQIVNGVAKYIGALQDRRGELRSAHRHIQSLGRLIRAIETATHTHAAKHREATAVVRECLFDSENQLRNLAKQISELGDEDASQFSVTYPTSPAIGYVIKKMKVKRKMMAYPFHLTKVQNLEKRLEAAISVLQSALLILNMYLPFPKQ